jgi:hypothetical protein
MPAWAVNFGVGAIYGYLSGEVTTKRGLASPCVHSDFATTRRWRLQLLRVLHTKSLKQRAGFPVRSLFAAACSSSLSISATSRSAALVVSGPAAAEWKEFNSVSEGFGVVFPADSAKWCRREIYSARYDNSLFKMTVVDGRDAGLLEAPVIDQALKRHHGT